MLQVRHWPLDEPHVTLIAGTAPEMVRALAPSVQDRFVLPLVIGPAQREMVLGPNDECGPVPTGVGEGLVQRVQF